MSMQVNYRSVFQEALDKSLIQYFFPTFHVPSPCFFRVSTYLSLSLPELFFVLIETGVHETRRNIISHHNSRDRSDLWLPTSLQPSLAGQGSEAKAIYHTQTIRVGGTQLHCSKNEKKTHLETDGKLKATPSITDWRLHEASKGKHTRR